MILKIDINRENRKRQKQREVNRDKNITKRWPREREREKKIGRIQICDKTLQREQDRFTTCFKDLWNKFLGFIQKVFKKGLKSHWRVTIVQSTRETGDTHIYIYML